MSTVREQVRAHVEANPGVHFNAIARDLDIATGQAQYHLRKLRRGDEVVAEEVRGKTHYYGEGYDPWERRVLAFARRETARAVLFHLLEADSLAAGELAERLDVARSTVAWHVSSLVEAGVLEKAYGERGTVVVSLTSPEETRRLLGEVTPSLTDRLVDRFVRLVDGTLGGAADDD
ncbi:winged helix-turn-helix transcriptional regulator [Haloarcula salina]|uniref:Helix-turn-helix domain-containing protein n=1 Tax=Haloarcula salina TaxID=1429914 RepID=A0AA41G3N4_9EURY|nr:helix-turn-helix domain-containing protein [Haloarcula salina]MBV0902986.1 helix-turn-helix domain-containing protein [Haloarcula salina]